MSENQEVRRVLLAGTVIRFLVIGLLLICGCQTKQKEYSQQYVILQLEILTKDAARNKDYNLAASLSLFQARIIENRMKEVTELLIKMPKHTSAKGKGREI